jgi:hypothetical protein
VGWRTSCLSNVSQIAKAMMMYVSDNDGYFPPRMPDPPPGQLPFPCRPCRTIDWRPYARPYVKSDQLFICPIDTGVPVQVVNDPMNRVSPRPQRMADFYGSSYCFFAALTRIRAEAAVPRPAETGMGGEIFAWHSGDALNWVLYRTGNPISVSYFVDGHATVTGLAYVTAFCDPPAIPDNDGKVMPVP